MSYYDSNCPGYGNYMAMALREDPPMSAASQAATWTALARLPGYTQLQSSLSLIQRAITLIDTTSPDAIAPLLAQTGAHAHVKASAAAFRAVLADDSTAFALIGRRQIAQQLLQAAGLPYMPADYA